MILSKSNLSKLPSAQDLTVPDMQVFSLPEKVLQFGTGVLLRGLPNYFIDKANRNGIFNGRVVVVKSTDKGSTDAYYEQDGLYTLCVRGIEDSQQVDKKIINSCISRVLSATNDWEEILHCAANKEMKVIISNTTETGIKLVRKDLITSNPPSSFPGKLLAFLYRRFKIFDGSEESGMVILPTELVPGNGQLLKSICVQLAEINHCEQEFIQWLISANDFCNTLVDRIVPGSLPEAEHKKVEGSLVCQDNLMIMAEPYRLWAIETTSDRTKSILSFSQIDKGVILADNIDKHREIKLRLLNAPHTFSCALAIWCGFATVKEAMKNEAFKRFVAELMHNEITPNIVGENISEEDAKVFADKVLDRFANPFIDHEWMSISAQYSSKMMMRCVPLLINHYRQSNRPPHHMTLGFAAYILFMKSEKNKEGQYVGNINKKEYVIYDDKASILYQHWQEDTAAKAVYSILSDEGLWNSDLTQLPEFAKAVYDGLMLIKSKSPEALLEYDLVASH